MKKSNVFTLFSLIFLIALVLQMLYLWQASSSKPQENIEISWEDHDIDLDETFDTEGFEEDDLVDEPLIEPTDSPEVEQSVEPTVSPEAEQSVEPTDSPEVESSTEPTDSPVVEPSAKPTDKPVVEPSAKPTNKPVVKPSADPTKSPTSKPTKKPTSKPTVKPTTKPKKEISPTMKGALFIGDSRTLGLMEYSGIEEADFFSNVGMSVYNIYSKDAQVPGVGEISLTDLLEKKEYDKVYFMVGINEMGYNLDKTIEKYKEVLAFIQEKQPGAIIFVQANMHVSKNRSDSDKVINNPAIDKMNSRIKKLANNKDIFYLNANPLFDDEEGNLQDGVSGDGVHLYARYYEQWGQWIARQTSRIVEKFF